MKQALFILSLFFTFLAHAQFSNSFTAQAPQTRYGVQVFGSMANEDRVSIAKDSLKVKYMRSSFTLYNWNGVSNSQYTTFSGAGMKVVLNVSETPQVEGTPRPYVSDTTTYASGMTSVTNAIQPDLLVIENEEINKTYFLPGVLRYITELQIAVRIAHAHGIKVTNGGLTGYGIDILTFRYLQTEYGSTVADEFAGHIFTAFQINQLNAGTNANLETKALETDTLLSAYKILDYVNIHELYEPLDPYADPATWETTETISANVAKWRMEYIMYRTGRPMISNEPGQKNMNANLVKNALHEFGKLNMEYIIWWGGDGNGNVGAKGLFDPTTLALRPNGIMFRNFMLRQIF